MTITPHTPSPHETLALKQFTATLQAAETSARTAIRRVQFFHQPETENLMGAKATYRDTENVWHDLTLQFHDQPDGGRTLAPTADTTQADPTPEYQVAIRGLAQIIRSAIGLYRIRITTATSQGRDRREASDAIISNLSAIAAEHLGSTSPAAHPNRTLAPEA